MTWKLTIKNRWHSSLGGDRRGDERPVEPASAGARAPDRFSRPRGSRWVGSSLLTRNDRPLDTRLALRSLDALKPTQRADTRSGARTSGAVR